MSRKKTLIIHIGDHKTGSTSIQTALAKGLISLEGKTIGYFAQLAHNGLARNCLDYAPERRRVRRANARIALETFAEKIEDEDADYVVISAEEFEAVPPTLVKLVVDDFFASTVDEVKVIGYVRPHMARITSSFGERTKIGAKRVVAGSLQDFTEMVKEMGSFTYHPRFTEWRELFGDNFIMRPMARQHLVNQSVVDDFAHSAFAGEEISVVFEKPENESLGIEDLMRLKVLQSTLDQTTQKIRHYAGWEAFRLCHEAPHDGPVTKITIHRELAQACRDDYLEDARAMDRDFFDGAPILENELESSVQNATDTIQSTDPADYFSASEMRSLQLLSQMVAGMIENENVSWGSFFHSKRLQTLEDPEPPISLDAAE